MDTKETESSVVDGYLVTLNGRAWGAAFGVLVGGGLFAATLVLVLRGGENVGQHLGLLRQYLPLYEVTFLGSIVGLVWGAIIGYVAGHGICLVYNRLAR